MTMTKIKTTFIFLIITLLLTQSCDNTISKGPKIDESKLVKTDIKIKRYGKALFEIDTNNFLHEVNKIQNEFSLFLGNNTDDTSILAPLYEYVTDTQLRLISEKTMEIYPDLISLENSLSGAFSKYNYFFPNKKIPVVYTYISDLYYEKPVIVDDSVVIIALDVYLGEDFPQYRSLGLPHYKIRCMSNNNIAVDVMKTIYVTDIIRLNKQKTMIDRMIAAGKLLYYLDAVLPDVPDSIKICYTSKQMKWVENNKTNVWAFFIKNKLFYSADYKLQTKLIQDGPFTTGFSNDSPPRLGIWLGWQIVRTYMDKHDNITLENLIQNPDAQGISNQSGYKP